MAWLNLNEDKDSFFGVFDGHRNSTVSDLLTETLIKYIQNNINYKTEIEKAIKEGY